MTDRMEDIMGRYHNHGLVAAHQCSSTVVQAVAAPLRLVWSIVRQFEKPKAYKRFVRSCDMLAGDGTTPGSVREVRVVSGLPAATSIERLDALDDELHLMVFSIVGGDHRLRNYQSTLTVHDGEDGVAGESVVIESYVVDIPFGNTKEDACLFADTIVRCNLRSLACVSEKMAISSHIYRSNNTKPLHHELTL